MQTRSWNAAAINLAIGRSPAKSALATRQADPEAKPAGNAGTPVCTNGGMVIQENEYMRHQIKTLVDIRIGKQEFSGTGKQ
jgi:hypothetical protein